MDGLFWTSRRHWWEQFNSTLIEFHLSETSGLCRSRTWTAGLTDRDANHCAISPPPRDYLSYVTKQKTGEMNERWCYWMWTHLCTSCTRKDLNCWLLRPDLCRRCPLSNPSKILHTSDSSNEGGHTPFSGQTLKTSLLSRYCTTLHITIRVFICWHGAV